MPQEKMDETELKNNVEMLKHALEGKPHNRVFLRSMLYDIVELNEHILDCESCLERAKTSFACYNSRATK